MATWTDIGSANYRAARDLFDSTQYRSACSRFYYAAFSILTDELIRRHALPSFVQNRATPGHSQLASLIDTFFSHLSEKRRDNLIREVHNLYSLRIWADYVLNRVDRDAARKAHRSAERIFEYMGVKP